MRVRLMVYHIYRYRLTLKLPANYNRLIVLVNWNDQLVTSIRDCRATHFIISDRISVFKGSFLFDRAAIKPNL